MFLDSVTHGTRMVDEDNLIRATGYLCLQIALLEDAVGACAAGIGVNTQCSCYTDRKLTAKIRNCKAKAQTLLDKDGLLEELLAALNTADTLSQHAQASIHAVIYGRPRIEGQAGVTADHITSDSLYALVGEVAAIAIKLMRLAP